MFCKLLYGLCFRNKHIIQYNNTILKFHFHNIIKNLLNNLCCLLVCRVKTYLKLTFLLVPNSFISLQ